MNALTERMLSTRSLAERWDCTPRTIQRMIKGGQLVARHIGGMTRIPLSEVLRHEEGGESCPDDPEATGSNGDETEASGKSVGPRIVSRSPEALARHVKTKRTSTSAVS